MQRGEKGWSFYETDQEEGVSENAQIGVTSFMTDPFFKT